MHRKLMAASLLLLALFPPSYALMDLIPYEGLWRNADTVAMGTATNITPHTGKTIEEHYTIITLQIERYYKNPQDDEILYIRTEGAVVEGSGVWVEDQPEFQMGEVAIVFLQLTDLTYHEKPLYRVYGAFQGKFQIVGDTAYGVYTLMITEDGLVFIPPEPLKVVELLIPENRTVYEAILGRIGLFNPGGQEFSGNFSLVFRGVSGACNGSECIYSHFAYIGPGRTLYGQIELNFTEPGIYDVFIWDDPMGSIRIHEAGYMSHEYELRDFKVTPSEAAVGQPVNITFTVKSSHRVSDECLYWLKVKALEGEYEGCLTVPMSATLEPREMVLSWYVFGTSGPGRFLAVVWFRGERVLEGSFTLHEAPVVDVDGGEADQMRYIYPLMLLAGFILLLIYSKHMRGRV